MRVSEKVREKLTVEARLKLLEGELGKMRQLEDELGKMRQLLSKLVEKGAEGSPSDPLTKGDLQAAAAESESAQPVPEEVSGTTENT